MAVLADKAALQVHIPGHRIAGNAAYHFIALGIDRARRIEAIAVGLGHALATEEVLERYPAQVLDPQHALQAAEPYTGLGDHDLAVVADIGGLHRNRAEHLLDRGGAFRFAADVHAQQRHVHTPLQSARLAKGVDTGAAGGVPEHQPILLGAQRDPARVRRRRAEKFLSHPAIPLAQVASLLGYTEQSSFIRGCKRWFATTPQVYRDRRDAAHPTEIRAAR
ncbi:helix-turn-helix domain-containing protein [Oxalobacteraceae bacterium]|nr:helix-turn-helix domain-containing protein [Oxalobacteraceae bacterium]